MTRRAWTTGPAPALTALCALVVACAPARAAPQAAAAPPLWLVDGRPTRQARAVVDALRDAAARGLRPADYDADALAAQLRALAVTPPDTAAGARFDRALTRALVRMLAHLHAGRVRPEALGFHLPESHRSVDVAAIARAVSRAADVPAAIAAAEPPYAGYAALRRGLARYRALAADTTLRPPAAVRGALRPGASYADAAALRRLLAALGDLAPVAAPSAIDGDTLYDGALADGVRAFQRRHGLDADGVIGPATLAQLRVPLAARVAQMELTLERWRWLPDVAPSRFAVVNVPAFRLAVFEHDPAAARPVLRMNVIVGQAHGRRHTPVFVGTMQQVVFRPYWDVPPSIARDELIPRLRRRPGYLEREALEIVRGGDDDAVVYPLTAANLGRVAAGTLRLRQRPGPRNSLGLVKFVFPNAYNVYLHGTPAPELFAHTRRDFSHGCIRVEDPPALAARVLRGQAGWDAAAIDGAMHGTVTRRVRIERPVTVFILYATVGVRDDGVVRFHPDIYGHDAALARALARRSMPDAVAARGAR